MNDITVTELKARIDAGTAPVMIDVREPHEWSAQHLPGVQKISLGMLAAPEIQDQIKGFGADDAEVVFICRSGGRSGQAVQFARQRLRLGNARNLIGGMLAWKAEIDPEFNV
ncbi:MAG: rhodanese-like domain-containing protein [Bacteroidia bacterium]